MSPSEAEALTLGVILVREDLTDRRTKSGRRNRYYRFGCDVGERRHEMSIYWPTRAGAWQAAVRWVKRLKDGRLA